MSADWVMFLKEHFIKYSVYNKNSPESFFDILKASGNGQATVEGAGSAAPSVAINFIILRNSYVRQGRHGSQGLVLAKFWQPP